MFRHKRSVYIIAFTLLGLLAMQGMWLYYAIKQEKHFLDSGTRQAALESLDALEQKEDYHLLVTQLDTILNMDSKKVAKTHSRPKTKNAAVRVMVTQRKTEMVVSNGSSSEVTITEDINPVPEIKITSPGQIVISSDEEKKAGNKVKGYEQLLKKIVYQSRPRKMEDRVNLNELLQLIKEKLVSRGIGILPEIAVKDQSDRTVFKTTGYRDAEAIVLPMFTKDIVFQDYTLHLFYPSTLSFIFKRAISVIVLSLFVTALLIIVILMLYRKMLTEQKLNQYKNDFINNLTHELKTPLATISLANSNITSAANYSNQQNIKQYTQIIDEENCKLNNHIEKVFELSLLEKEKQIFSSEPVNVHHLVRDCIVSNNQLLESKQAIVNLKLDAGHHLVMADRFHFENVLFNLLDNALKYGGTGVKIEIESRNESDTLIVSVKDNGIGISKEHQQFIFDKFFRVTHKDLHTTKGFGIGLSYVKQTVELFKGKINVVSEENRGAEFIITLPYAKA